MDGTDDRDTLAGSDPAFQIPMLRHTLFISDLHLSASRPQTTELFLQFLKQRAAKAESLYILGDLFDAYIGDDDNSSPNREIKTGLANLVNHGTAVYFLHGNRDFLLSDGFYRQTGVQILPEIAVIEVYGQHVAITHGDLLCTDDVQYQQARTRVRAPEWKANALSKPLLVRQLYAKWYRFKSSLDKRGKTRDIMDVNNDAVAAMFRQCGVDLLIHGHTHRPACHQLLLDEARCTRIVLSEWTENGHFLSWIEGEDKPRAEMLIAR